MTIDYAEHRAHRAIDEALSDIVRYYQERLPELSPFNGTFAYIHGGKLQYGDHMIKAVAMTEEFRGVARCVALDLTFDDNLIGRITAPFGKLFIDATDPTPHQRADEQIKNGKWPAEQRAKLTIRELISPYISKLKELTVPTNSQ